MEEQYDEDAQYGGGSAAAYSQPETPAAYSQPDTPARAGVENSLHGLVTELDKLRESLGYNSQLHAIEQHLSNLQAENDELRTYAEQAIMEAERLAGLNEELSQRVHQQQLDEQMGAVLTETQKLKDVADEFEKDLVLQKLAEAEERVGEITALKARVRELEEENGALTQTLEEMRQSSEQLQRLRAMEEQQGAGAAAAAATFAAAVASERSAAAAAAGRAAEAERGAATTAMGAPAGKSKGKAASAAAGSSRASAGGDSATAASAAVAPASPPRSPAASVSSAGGAGGPGSQAGGPAAPPPPPPPPAGKGREATRLAEQLAAAAGGADVGVVASAAKCLRDYAALEAALTHERQEAERLRHEVEELRDTMFSKSFKPPSAWAEREVKYKMEKKAWEDRHKEVAGRLAVVEAENAEYRAAGKAHEFEERIHELEAQLLQTEREKDDARAQLHELQLTLRSQSESSPELRYSPYRPGGRPDEGEGVHSVVAELEQRHIGMAPPPSAEASHASLPNGRLGPGEEGEEIEGEEGSAFGAGAAFLGGAALGAAAGAASTPGAGGRKSEKLRALAKDRASADAAWEEHNKKSDVAGLRRSKAELETKVAMLEQQIGKMQWAIEHADQQQAVIEEQLDTAIQTGDVKNLSGLREKLKAGLASPGKVFRRQKGPSPAKLAMSKQLHQTTDALRSSEAEKNALRRQLAKLSKKYKAMAAAGGAVAVAADATGEAALAPAVAEVPPTGGAGEAQQQGQQPPAGRASLDGGARRGAPAAAPGAGSEHGVVVAEPEDFAAEVAGSYAYGTPAAEALGGGAGAAAAPAAVAAGSLAGSYAARAASLDDFASEDLDEFLVPGIDDSEMEVLALREENELLMDQLVTTKVRLAETEGEFLRSKRELLRAEEKQQQMEERLQQLQREAAAAAAAAAQSPPLGPLGAGAPAAAAAEHSFTTSGGGGAPGAGSGAGGGIGGMGGAASITSRGSISYTEELGGAGASFMGPVGSPAGSVSAETSEAGRAAGGKETKRSKSWIGGLKL